MPYKSVYVIHPDMPVVFYTFTDQATYPQWDAAVRAVKHTIEGISLRLERENRMGEGILDDYRVWINMVYSFMQRFGKNLPYDIADALNSVEEGVGLPLTPFDKKWKQFEKN